MYVIVLSGPARNRDKASTALLRAGFALVPHIPHPKRPREIGNHGLPSHRDGRVARTARHAAGFDMVERMIEAPEGSKAKPRKIVEVIGRRTDHPDYEHDPSVGWLTVIGADVDQAAFVADPFKWLLRMHWEEQPKPEEPTLDELVRGYKSTLSRLEEAIERKVAEQEALR